MIAMQSPTRWLALLCALLFATTAHAQATRTWVSGVGNDADPCSRTAPCKTFAGAMSKTAAGGVISVLDPGGYGAVTVNKAITLDGNGMGSIIGSLTTGILVNAGAGDEVTIRNLGLFGVGNGLNGIRIVSAQAVHVDHVVISGFKAAGASSGNGILMNPSTAVVTRLYVNDSLIHNNGSTTNGGGILSQPTGGAITYTSVERSSIDANLGYGIKAFDNSHLNVRASTVSGNKKSGIAADGQVAFVEATVDGTTLNDNGWDTSTVEASVLSRGSNAVVTLKNNVISNNEFGVRRVTSGFIYTTGDNLMVSNTSPGTVTGAATEL
jgi:hypothetical protein